MLDGISQPFVTALFSASSHHPFLLPDRYTGKFPEGPHPINRCIGYTDMALRRFFETASHSPWYYHTLFVITADHAQSQPQQDIYRTPAGSFEVPVVFYTPDGSLSGKNDRLIQQIDIMPVVLGYLKYPKPYFAFGSDVLNGTGENCVINYINGTYQFFYGNLLLISTDKETKGLFNFKEDRLLQHNLTGKAGAVQDSMELRMKAFIQQYHNRMLENRISVPLDNKQ
jgi:phosphoglycerol transferase MdoB-like AlkP superfamily enzyme